MIKKNKKDNEKKSDSGNKIEINYEAKAEENAKKYPADIGTILYDKNHSKFTGMYYYFKGDFIKYEMVEGLSNKMEKALLMRNENGYVMPIFPPYEIPVEKGDIVEAWGNLSGDGYNAFDFDVENVVGMTGAINAFRINVNGEMR